jgi:hypothetical protein
MKHRLTRIANFFTIGEQMASQNAISNFEPLALPTQKSIVPAGENAL